MYGIINLGNLYDATVAREPLVGAFEQFGTDTAIQCTGDDKRVNHKRGAGMRMSLIQY